MDGGSIYGGLGDVMMVFAADCFRVATYTLPVKGDPFFNHALNQSVFVKLSWAPQTWRSACSPKASDRCTSPQRRDSSPLGTGY